MRAPDEQLWALQDRHFEQADAELFRWVTVGAGFAETEDALLAPFLDAGFSPGLEIGCGEGGNLFRLHHHGTWVGVDRSPAKVAFAATQLPAVRFAAADASRLPFGDGAFGAVWVRDLLHHVPAPAHALAEAVRVLAPGGRLTVLEPNGRSPLIQLQTLLVPAERGARRSGAAHIRGLLESLPLENIELRMLQPLPLRRLVLHQKLGLPSLGRIRAIKATLAAIEGGLGRFVPRSRWTYVAVTGQRCGLARGQPRPFESYS